MIWGLSPLTFVECMADVSVRLEIFWTDQDDTQPFMLCSSSAATSMDIQLQEFSNLTCNLASRVSMILNEALCQ